MLLSTYNRLHVHVSASNIQVIKRFSRKALAPNMRFCREVKAARKHLYRELLDAHQRARKLYEFVVVGNY